MCWAVATVKVTDFPGWMSREDLSLSRGVLQQGWSTAFLYPKEVGCNVKPDPVPGMRLGQTMRWLSLRKWDMFLTRQVEEWDT